MTDEVFKGKVAGVVLDLICPIPSKGDCGDRCFHDDLKEMSEAVRLREAVVAWLRFFIDPNPRPWLQKRCDLLKETLWDALKR